MTLVVTAPGTHGRDALQQRLYREAFECDVIVETGNSGFTIACVQARSESASWGTGGGRLVRAWPSVAAQAIGTASIVFLSRRGRRPGPLPCPS